MRTFSKISRIELKSLAPILLIILFLASLSYAFYSTNKSGERNTKVKIQSGGPCNADPAIDGEESSFVGLLNQYRATHNLPPLTISTGVLSQMAQWTANDLVNNPAFGHVDTIGRDTQPRAVDCGITGFPSEILDEGGFGAGMQTAVTGASALAIFEGSTEHNAIILDSAGPYTQIGVGHIVVGGKGYWAAEFLKAGDETNGGTGNAGAGGGTTTGSGGGVTQCSCLDGGIINPETGVQDDHFTGQCGHSAYTGTDGGQWTCTDAGWQPIPAGGCINGHIEDATTGKPITKFYLGTNTQPVCGDDNKEYKCTNGNWIPTNNSCGPGSTGGGTTGGGTTGGGTTGGGGTQPKTCDQVYQSRGYASYAAACGSIGATTCVPASNTTGRCDCTPNCSNPNSSLTPTVKPTATATPSPTPSPTAAPTNTPTPSPTLSPTLTQTPTPTATIGPTATNVPTATPTLPPNETQIAVAFSSLGIGGNTSKGENNNPVSQTRTVNIQIFDTSGQKVKDVTANLNFRSADFSFQGQLSLGTNLPNGTYVLKARYGNSLLKAKTIGLTAGQNNSIPTLQLIVGDFDQNNRLDLLDYNAFISCYGASSCANRQQADFNLDGNVNEKDLNILYTEFSTRQGD